MKCFFRKSIFNTIDFILNGFLMLVGIMLLIVMLNSRGLESIDVNNVAQKLAKGKSEDIYNVLLIYKESLNGLISIIYVLVGVLISFSITKIILRICEIKIFK